MPSLAMESVPVTKGAETDGMVLVSALDAAIGSPLTMQVAAAAVPAAASARAAAMVVEGFGSEGCFMVTFR